MIKKYVDACKEAGMSKEQIREIRRVFDGDCKKLKRENQTMEVEGYLCFSIYDSDTGEDRVEIPDSAELLEDALVKREMLKALRSALEELDPQDKEILMAYFDDEVSFSEFARSVGKCRVSLLRRKETLLKLLREKMGEWR